MESAYNDPPAVEWTSDPTGNDVTVKPASRAFCRVCLEIQAGGVNLTGLIRVFVTYT